MRLSPKRPHYTLHPVRPSVRPSAVVKAPKSTHITPILKAFHSLKVNERIEYKLLSLTYNQST